MDTQHTLGSSILLNDLGQGDFILDRVISPPDCYLHLVPCYPAEEKANIRLKIDSMPIHVGDPVSHLKKLLSG